VIMHRMTEETE